jgi:hypothetical protein
MSRHLRFGKTVTQFAGLGLAVAAAAYAYAALHDYSKPMGPLGFLTVFVSIILCPPQLIFAACIDCEVVGRDGLIMYSIIGVLNAAFYAVIGAVVFRLRTRSQEPH